MSWDYFHPASRSEGCSRQCVAPASNSPDAAAWLPLPPALHPSPRSDRERTRHSKSLSSAASSSRVVGCVCRYNLLAGRMFPTRVGPWNNHARRALYRVIRRCPRCASPSLTIRNKIDLVDPAQIRAWTGRLGIAADDLQRVAGKVGNSIAAVSKEIDLRKAPAPRPSSPVQIHLASLPALAAVVTEVQLTASGS
jgi:hypothetical protein